jgi:hypothetical protein
MGEGKQTVGLVEAWKVDDAGQPEYLDGIELQFAVQNASGCNVAFVFDGDAARRIALVPEMLDLIETIELAMKRGRHLLRFLPASIRGPRHRSPPWFMTHASVSPLLLFSSQKNFQFCLDVLVSQFGSQSKSKRNAARRMFIRSQDCVSKLCLPHALPPLVKVLASRRPYSRSAIRCESSLAITTSRII